jgi:hypothetical protein
MKQIIQFKQWILSIGKRIFFRKMLADERLDYQDFYEIMQTYRHTPMTEQDKLVNAFEDLKKWIRENYA